MLGEELPSIRGSQGEKAFSLKRTREFGTIEGDGKGRPKGMVKVAPGKKQGKRAKSWNTLQVKTKRLCQIQESTGSQGRDIIRSKWQKR